MKFKFNELLKDTLTGYVGVVTAKYEHIYSGNEYLLESKSLKKGKKVTEWFNEKRLRHSVTKVLELPDSLIDKK